MTRILIDDTANGNGIYFEILHTYAGLQITLTNCGLRRVLHSKQEPWTPLTLTTLC